jgi:hypothetical protein
MARTIPSAAPTLWTPLPARARHPHPLRSWQPAGQRLPARIHCSFPEGGTLRLSLTVFQVIRRLPLAPSSSLSRSTHPNALRPVCPLSQFSRPGHSNVRPCPCRSSDRCLFLGFSFPAFAFSWSLLPLLIFSGFLFLRFFRTAPSLSTAMKSPKSPPACTTL